MSSVCPRCHVWYAAVVTMRPRQWTKNALVVAAAGAAGALGRPDVAVRVVLTLVAFCLLAGGVYAVNDVRDAAEDRGHARKRHRPVAAGELDPHTATLLGGSLMLAGLCVCALVRPLLAVVGAGYLALALTYTLIWRRMVVVDLVAIAGGFVLRAVAGGVAADVMLSRRFLLVITCAAMFVAAGKRRAELRWTVGSVRGRSVLALYSETQLSLILWASAAGALVSYAAWALQRPDSGGFPWRPATLVPFAACLLRYATLLWHGEGEAPEELLTADRRLQLAALAWLVLFSIGVHGPG